MDEEWRAVVGFEGLYEVSNLGRVRSLDCTIEQRNRYGVIRYCKPGRFLRAEINRDGHLQVTLCAKGRAKHARIHVLVAEAFIGARPQGLEVCHCDGVHTNNVPGNLRYDTRAANSQDAVTHGAQVRGERVGLARLSESDVQAIRRLRGTKTLREIAKDFSVALPTVHHVLSGRTWRHV
jgi:hypothetical protein